MRPGCLATSQAILHALADHAGPFRLPQKQANTLYRLERMRGILADRLGRQPTDREMAKELEISLDDVRVLTQAWHYIIKAGLLDKDQPLAMGMRNLVASIDRLPETDEQTTLVQHRMCLIPVGQLGDACRDIVTAFDARSRHSSGTTRDGVTESSGRSERAVASP